MSPRMGFRLALLLAFAGVTVQAGALAGEPTAADRETARTLLFDGRAKLAAGDTQGALKAFQAAHAIMGVPTTGLDLSKAQAALGMLVEARATALDMARMEQKAGEPAAFKNARQAAAKFADELATRIPSIEIQVKGLPPGKAPNVAVDGVAVPAEAVGLPRKVNPGEHTVQVEAPGYVVERRTVTLKEGETLPLNVSLAPAPGGEDGGGLLPAESSASGGPAPDEGTSPGVPAWAWASGAAGLVALGVGVAFAIDYSSVRSTVAADCPGDVCDRSRYSAEDLEDLKARWNRDLGLSVGLGAMGLAGIGIALYGIISEPKSSPSEVFTVRPERVTVAPLIGQCTGATVRGMF